MLRLNPAHPPLWRDAETLQFGIPPVAVISRPVAWHDRLLLELERGISDLGFLVAAECLGVRPAAARALIAQLQPALVHTRLESSPPTRHHVSIEAPHRDAKGTAALVRTLGGALEDDGFVVSYLRERPGSSEPVPLRAPVTPSEERDPAAPTPRLAVLVADHALAPARARAHVFADRRHLPIVITGTGIQVGPLITPGVTACSVCLDLHRRDEDAAWPTLAPQLLTALPMPADAALAHEAAAALLHLIATSPLDGGGVTVSPEGRVRTVHPPHAECGCQAPRESATVHAHPARRVPTTTAKPLAVPA